MLHVRGRSHRIRISTAAALASFYSQLALADAPTAAPPEIQSEGEIVVTAQKRTERANEVPLSITAVSGDQLLKQGISTPADLVKVTPGLTYTESVSALPVYTIRGIGFFDDSTADSPAVSVYVDQVPLPFAIMTEGASLDPERVEVLKGPQGTLFGQNSTGGAINYVAAKPKDHFSAGADLTYARFNEVDAQGFVTGQLADGLTFRLAARTEQRTDGWQHTYVPGDDRTLGKKNFSTGRLLLDWTASDALKFELNFNGWKDRSDMPASKFLLYAPIIPIDGGGSPEQYHALNGYPPAPHTPGAAEWDPNVNFRRNDGFYQIALHGDWTVARDVTITSITSFANLSTNEPIDADGTAFSDSFQVTLANIKTFNQELRISGNNIDRLKWMIGGNYEHDIADEDRVFTNFNASDNNLGGYSYYGFRESNHQGISTRSVFGSLDYKITSKLTAQGSVRYTRQDRTFDGCLFDNGTGDLADGFSFLSNVARNFALPLTAIQPGGCVTLDDNYNPVTIVTSKLDQDNVSWRGGLDWKINPATMIYANVTRGYKAGNYSTLPGSRVSQLMPVPQESVLAYEAGFKLALFNRTLEMTAAGFYYDYTDKQISGFINTGFPFGTLPGLVTIPKSRVFGSELNMVWRPVRGLRFAGGATFVDSRIQSHSDPLVNPIYNPFGQPVDAHGQPFPNTPKWSVLGDIEYDFNVSTRMAAYVGGSGTWRSQTNAAIGNDPLFKIPGYALFDLRAGIETRDGHWNLQIFGRNILNKYYPIIVTNSVDTVTALSGMGATYGATIAYRF